MLKRKTKNKNQKKESSTDQKLASRISEALKEGRFDELMHELIAEGWPKEKIIETYGEKSDGILVPFSEYLFSCNEKLYGEKLCALMKLYSVDKRVHVFWGISNTSSGKRIDREYVFFTKKILDKIGEDALDKLLDKGFTPLVFERFYIKQK